MISHSSNNEDYICFLSANLNFAISLMICFSCKNMELNALFSLVRMTTSRRIKATDLIININSTCFSLMPSQAKPMCCELKPDDLSCLFHHSFADFIFKEMPYLMGITGEPYQFDGFYKKYFLLVFHLHLLHNLFFVCLFQKHCIVVYAIFQMQSFIFFTCCLGFETFLV